MIALVKAKAEKGIWLQEEIVPIRNEQGIEEFVRDSSGQPILSKLDENTLQAIAQATGGIYSQLSSDSLDQLYNSVIARLPREERESELQEVGIERFQWALAFALVFLVFDILIRRRRSAGIDVSMLILATLTLSPTDTIAKIEEDASYRGGRKEGSGAPRQTTKKQDKQCRY